ncbi:glycosyltransferase family 2 protein [Cesiribacter andamanensis]|uniref:Putative glycosyl transferase n=1 Tax=Cesiribacter andamanensis AMV16 TaxID=1279009 RepID=M7NQI7_9BACT|nr:glycosyltransferase [Cesiribacter andamanensis]EMR03990.1 putative glycosyl transferase [Cesiribacter andamanensis AMV16]
MISIITSVHNQLGMNQLYMEYLTRYTHYPFELIVIDNASTDGTLEFFREHADVVIANEVNYSYPYCQNQGVRAARYDILAFLNNDILVSPEWDLRMLEVMQEHGLEIASFATNDHLENRKAQKALNRRWKRIKYPTQALFGTGKGSLQLMARLMYGNWERWCERRYQQFGKGIKEGFSGSSIIMRRSALEKLGPWDERLQAADFDLYFRSKDRSLQQGDIKPMMLATGVYIHHYQRLTSKAKRPAFVDAANHISLTDKWGDKARLYNEFVEN